MWGVFLIKFEERTLDISADKFKDMSLRINAVAYMNATNSLLL